MDLIKNRPIQWFNLPMKEKYKVFTSISDYQISFFDPVENQISLFELMNL